jgi:hypothetical protein
MYIYILIGLLSFLTSMAAYGLNGDYYKGKNIYAAFRRSIGGALIWPIMLIVFLWRGMLEIIRDIWSA